MKKKFYKAFEDKFRGPRGLVKSRLTFYLPFIQLLKDHHGTVNGIDLGCGRGEWLELLTENGCIAIGIDINEAMLEPCKELKLTVKAVDALKFLRSLPNASQSIISGFHIVEHLNFDYLQSLVLESKRVLRPGGLLIFETPNPENIVVGSSQFYLDPTHQRPIPPALLAFIPEHVGFTQIKIVRLQEQIELLTTAPSLLDVLNGVSPDYAVIAQTAGNTELLNAMGELFSKEYGLTLNTLSNYYQQHNSLLYQSIQQEIKRLEITEQRITQSEAKIQQESQRAELAEQRAIQTEHRAQQETQRAELAEQRSIQIEHRAQQDITSLKEKLQIATQQISKLEDGLNKVQAELHQVHQANHHHYQQLETTRLELSQVLTANHHHWQLAEARQQQIQTILDSTSWKITAPLRKNIHKLKVLFTQSKNVNFYTTLLFKHAFLYINRRPKLRNLILNNLQHNPKIKAYLKKIVLPHDLPSIPSSTQINNEIISTLDLSHLSLHARRVYADLKAAIDQGER